MAWIPIAASVAGSVIGGMLNRQGGANETTTSVGTRGPWEPTIPYLNQFMQNNLNQPRPVPYANDPSQMVAPLTPEQQAARGTIMDATGRAGQTVAQGQQALTPFLSGQYMDVKNNPYLQSAMDSAIRPITQNYRESVLPSIRGNFNVGTDAVDQSKEGIAQGVASRGYLDAVSGVTSSMANRGYETGLNATQNAIGQIPGLTTAAIAPGQAQWNIGALIQGHEQNLRNAPLAIDQLQQQRLNDQFRWLTGIGGLGGTQNNIISAPPGSQPNPWLGALGGAQIGMGLGNMWGGGGGSAGGGATPIIPTSGGGY